MFQIQVRAIIGVMIFLGYFFIYVVRYNISVHIVDMAHIPEEEAERNYSVLLSSHIERVGNVYYLVWDDMKIAKLFSAYHIGYCVCFPLFHNVGDRLGPTWVVGISGITSGVLNCLTPAAAFISFWYLFVVRMLIGFCAGAMLPSMVQLLRNWVPPVERNYFVWVSCGITLGTFFTLVLCALVQYHSRWPRGFYIAGAVQIGWALLWVTLVTDTPTKHTCISEQEAVFLSHTIGNTFTIKRMNAQAPWSLILRSKAFWILCMLNFGYAWLIIAMSLYGTLYYSRVVKYSLYSAAMLTALPFLLRFILGTVVVQALSWYAHHNKDKNVVKSVRKYFIVVSHVLPGLIVIVLWMTPAYPGPVILTTSVALTAAGMDLILDLCYDITPTFANSVYTLIKIIGNFPGIIISFCVGAATQKFHNSLEVWKHIWCCHALVLLLCGLLYLLWGDTTAQPWHSTAQYRPHRAHTIRLSAMSKILETDENDRSVSSSQQLPQQSSSPAYKSIFSSMPLKLPKQPTSQ